MENDSRIIVDKDICSGKPVVRGTRILVRNILGIFAGGYTIQRILEEYPQLTREDVTSAVKYARDILEKR